MADLANYFDVELERDGDTILPTQRADRVQIKDANGVWHVFTASPDGNLKEVLEV